MKKDEPAAGKEAAAGEFAGERIAKVIARAGICSRRDAERLIEEGRVSVDGEVLKSPARNVGPDNVVVVDGKPLAGPDRTRLWRYHKPAGLVTTHKDPEGRRTVFDALRTQLPRVISIGRLDLNSEGLLLLTNDGALARRLELPETGWTRRYRVRVHGTPDPERLAALAKGITVEGIQYGGIEAAIDRVQGRNAWLTVGLKEGKNREVRRVLEHLGLQVSRLIRIAYGPFQLGMMEPGGVDEVPPKVIREQLGLKAPKRVHGAADSPVLPPAPKPADGRPPRKPRPVTAQSSPRRPETPPPRGRRSL